MRRAAPLALAAAIGAAAAAPASAEPVRVLRPAAVRPGPRPAPGIAPRFAPRVGRLPRIGPRFELRRWRYGLAPVPRRRRPDLPPLLLPLPPDNEFVQPEGPGTSPLLEDTPDNLPALSHGFHFNVAVGAGQSFAVPPSLTRFIQVGQALGRCFAVPTSFRWGSVTLRVAFKRDGSVFGVPRVPYTDAPTADQKTELADSLLAGLKRCAPLPLSPSLGAAVAGEIFAIRFINEDPR